MRQKRACSIYVTALAVALSRIYAEDRTTKHTKFTKRKAAPCRPEVADQSLDGNWKVKPVIRVRPLAWL
jgi:hypothetical protein